MGLRTYLLLVCLLTKKDTVTSLSLSCNAGVIEVVEGRQKIVTCNGLRAEDTVQWKLHKNNEIFDLGVCSQTSAPGVFTCTESSWAQIMTSSRTMGTESVLVIDFSTQNDVSIEKVFLGTLKCQIQGTGPFDACQIDFVYPPEGNCAVQILKDVSPWQVKGYCNITKALSLLRRYSCQWYLERELSEEKFGPSVNMTTRTTQSGGRYVSGSCEMPPDMKFPTTAGKLMYKVAFTPEKNVTATADGISEVQRPSQPTVICDPKPYVPENTSVSCTCHTQSVGIPGGYLKWSKGSKDIFNTVINIGTFDVTSLSMVPYILQKTDHNSTQFRCDVVWAENITGSVYMASVAYIEPPKLSINSSQNITVNENQVVVFNCQAVGVPVPTLRLIDINVNKQLTVQSSPMLYKIAAATCEDTTTYTCVATNSVTGGQNISANLYVNCKPRSNPPLTTPQELSPVNYMNKTEQQDFTVVAYPSPVNFTFIYLGSNRNLTVPDKAATDIYLNVTCSSSKLIYVSKCTLTVDNVSSSAVGVYQVTIGNAFGSEAFTFTVNISVHRMEPCGLDKTLEIIEEKENNTVVCSVLKAQDNLTWVFETLNSSIVGRCPWPPENYTTDTCINIIQPDVFLPRRTSVNESILIINPTLIKNKFPWTSGKLSCQTQSFIDGCQLDLVYSAQCSCSVEFRRESDSWIVYGMCNITKAYSARGRYGCQWYQSLGASSYIAIGTFSMMSTVSNSLGEKYISGLCHIPRNIAMPTVGGNYNYTVTVIPGMVNIPVRAEILRPSRPTISCSPSPYVPENRNITCTCNTQSVGVPGGRLQWSLARNNSFNVLNTGIYDATNLEMLPQKVSLHDHETMQIRCDVDWAEPIFGDTYTVLVGYSPSQSELKLNQKMDEHSVSESETVAFECQADGRPTPIIRLVTQNETRELGNSISPLLFNLSAVQCEDTGVYICIASNGMGEVKRSIAKLYVKCKPRGISGTISPKQLSVMIFIAHPVEQTFSVIAYPSPNNFTVTFLGSGKNTCESEAVVKGVVMNVMYTHTENIYTINIKLTIVNVTSAAAFGFYRIRLSNEYGYGDFVFEIQSPTISIQDEKDTLARYIGIGVGVGVGVMLAVDVIIILVVWIYRQQVISKCIDKSNTDSSNEMTTLSNVFQNNIETSYNIPEDNSNSKENFTTQTNMQPNAYQQDSERLYNLPDDEQAYDSMRRNELGVMSSYARLDQIETVAVSSQEYQNMKRFDIKPHLTNTTII